MSTTTDVDDAAVREPSDVPADAPLGPSPERTAPRRIGAVFPAALLRRLGTAVRRARAVRPATVLRRIRQVRPVSLVPFVPVLVLIWQGWDRRWVTDDGFIFFRVVDMVHAGHGPVFNAGERVEATTSALWLWYLVIGDLLVPFKLEWVAVLSGIGLTAAGFVLATAASIRLWRGMGTTSPMVPAGAAVLAVLPPIWDFSTSGLEGGLTFFWIGAVAWTLARWAVNPERQRLSIPGAMLIGLGPLVRPDMTLVAGVVLVAVLAAQWRDGGWKPRLRLVAAAAALPLAYEIFRMGYYATLVPNTALAKNASSARWSTGWFYLRDLVEPYDLWLPVLLVVAVVGGPLVGLALRRGNVRALVAIGALPLAGVLAALYVIRVGGDYMHGRLLLPMVWALLAPLAAAPLPRLSLGRSRAAVASLSRADALRLGRWAGVLGVVVWAVVCAGWLRHPGARIGEGSTVVDGRAGLVRAVGHDHPVTTWDQHAHPRSPLHNLEPGEVYLNNQPVDVDPPDDLPTPAFAAWGVGMAGYVLGTDYYVVDMLGLGDPIESRLVVERPSQPGHEKPMPIPWIAARVSDGRIDRGIEMPEPELVLPLYESPVGQLDEDSAAARRAIECAAVQELLEAVRGRLTVGRFVDNVLSAPRLTRLEIPADPQEAARELCP